MVHSVEPGGSWPLGEYFPGVHAGTLVGTLVGASVGAECKAFARSASTKRIKRTPLIILFIRIHVGLERRPLLTLVTPANNQDSRSEHNSLVSVSEWKENFLFPPLSLPIPMGSHPLDPLRFQWDQGTRIGHLWIFSLPSHLEEIR